MSLLKSRLVVSSTHSGWIDLILSFGLPIITLFIAIFTAIAANALVFGTENQIFILSTLFATLVLYGFGELSNKHSVEILFFFVILFIWDDIN